MGETLREKMDAARARDGRDPSVVDWLIAEHTAAMEARIAALELAERERNAVVPPPTDAPAGPVDGVWPVGSRPPLAVGQCRASGDARASVTYVIVGVNAALTDWEVQWNDGRVREYLYSSLVGDPLSEPWFAPVATPDPRIAELEAHVRGLEAMNRAQAVEWRAAEELCRDANGRSRELQTALARLTAERDAAVKRAEAAEAAQENRVEWVVNDNAELGVRIGGVCYFLYKGNSLVYRNGKHDDGRPMMVRLVGKREFGECCAPLGMTQEPRSYTAGDGWEAMKAADGAHVGASEK